MSFLTKQIIKVTTLNQDSLLASSIQLISKPITQVILFSILIGLILILIFKKHL